MSNAETFWDNTAKNYDREEKRDEKTYLKIIEKTIKHLKTNDTVLDFGCGTGLVSNEIAGNVKFIHAIDISSNMIRIAKDKAADRKIDNVVYSQSTLFDQQLNIGSFDVILTFYILHLVEDSQKVMQRINELLKPEGLMISATPCIGEKPIMNGLFSMAGKIGIIPTIKAFKKTELEDSIAKEKFEIIETEWLHQSSLQYFIAAKKILSSVQLIKTCCASLKNSTLT
jgi:2-polyprenyl-3-methyl-5-hydroxy-6-metoxy-1,4-benzoquinol methylase